MARPAIDISILGDKELEKKLAALGSEAAQKKAVRPALRKSIKRIRTRVIQHLSGLPVQPQTGRLLVGMASVKPQSLRRSRGTLGVVLPFPSREQLGIDPKDKYFYPAAVEYGHVRGAGKSAAPPHPFIRPAVDNNSERELSLIAADIGKGIIKQAMKK